MNATMRDNWIAAAKLGLLSSTFSTITSHLAASRIGRDPWVDWMSVAAIPLRDGIITQEPTWLAAAAGILFHQWADFSWALVFFGLLGRWTADLRPAAILPIAVVWALFTSASEWAVLVPLFPFWQPIFPLQQPYWIGFSVHLTSAVVYPLFRWLRDEKDAFTRSAFLRVWSGFLLAALGTLVIVSALAQTGREVPLLSRDPAGDRLYMRRMVSHHEQGLVIAALGAERAQDTYLKALARLMVATQAGENRLLRSWWDSWFDEPFELCTAQESAARGMISDREMDALRTSAESSFDQQFIATMTTHHKGAIKMADDELHSDGDPRLRVMAHGIRHEQQGEIALMHGVQGTEAVATAIANMLANNQE